MAQQIVFSNTGVGMQVHIIYWYSTHCI